MFVVVLIGCGSRKELPRLLVGMRYLEWDMKDDESAFPKVQRIPQLSDLC